MSKKIVTIIPAAGLGTRMAMEKNQSKEMLPDPDNNGKPIIDWCLGFVENPLIITREEKTDLIDYCNLKEIPLRILPHETDHWVETVLYGDNLLNVAKILVLPDTRFNIDCYHEVVKKTKNLPYECNWLVAACHMVQDGCKWGCIVGDRIFEKYELHSLSMDGYAAWGILGWKNSAGWLYQMIDPGITRNLNIETITMEYFKDITRTEEDKKRLKND